MQNFYPLSENEVKDYQVQVAQGVIKVEKG